MARGLGGRILARRARCAARPRAPRPAARVRARAGGDISARSRSSRVPRDVPQTRTAHARGADAAQPASARGNGRSSRAAAAAARLLQMPHGGGFQYGGAPPRPRASSAWRVCAAACGALADGLALGAAALFEAGAVRGLLVELTRRRSGRALWLRFVELDLHDAQASASSARRSAWGGARAAVTSGLKGTEQALRYQPELRAGRLPALAPARAREPWPRARLRRRSPRAALNAWRRHPGRRRHPARAPAGVGRRRHPAAGATEALGALACASPRATRTFGMDSPCPARTATAPRLGQAFGYCELVENADDRRAFARHGPTASELESLAGDRNDPHEAHRVFCCHMLVAFRRMRPLLERGSGPRHR